MLCLTLFLFALFQCNVKKKGGSAVHVECVNFEVQIEGNSRPEAN